MWRHVYGTSSYRYGKVPVVHHLVLLKMGNQFRLWDMNPETESGPKLVASFLNLREANSFTSKFLADIERR